jgi:hypothetical protein
MLPVCNLGQLLIPGGTWITKLVVSVIGTAGFRNDTGVLECLQSRSDKPPGVATDTEWATMTVVEMAFREIQY